MKYDSFFKKICKKCKGLCCKRNAFVSKNDLKKLDKVKTEFEAYYWKNGRKILLENEKCPFLGRNGCRLKEKEKPFDCLLFPLSFTIHKKKFYFYLNGKCPYLKKFSRKWIKERRKWALRELRKWKGKEILSYAEHCRLTGKLIDVKGVSNEGTEYWRVSFDKGF